MLKLTFDAVKSTLGTLVGVTISFRHAVTVPAS